MIGEILEAWRVNQRINLLLIDRIGDEGMLCTLSSRGGRNVVRQFAHLQYVRAYQLNNRAKRLAQGIRIFETNEEPDRRTLSAALSDSSERIEEWFRRAHAKAPGVRTSKRGLVPAVA
jgi:hypothetical protein